MVSACTRYCFRIPWLLVAAIVGALFVSPTHSEEYAATIKADSPVVYFRMNESTGTTATSVAGQPATLRDGTTIAAQPTSGTGPLLNQAGPRGLSFLGFEPNNRSIKFDGDGQFPAPHGDNALIENHSVNTSTYSIEVWFNSTRTNEAQPITGYIVGRSSESVGIAGFHAENPERWGRLFIFSASQMVYGKSVVKPHQWYHLVHVRKNDDVWIYLNGVLEINAKVSAVINATDAFILGCRPDIAGAFSGRLDELAIYDRALFPTEVTAHYRSAVAP